TTPTPHSCARTSAAGPITADASVGVAHAPPSPARPRRAAANATWAPYASGPTPTATRSATAAASPSRSSTPTTPPTEPPTPGGATTAGPGRLPARLHLQGVRRRRRALQHRDRGVPAIPLTPAALRLQPRPRPVTVGEVVVVQARHHPLNLRGCRLRPCRAPHPQVPQVTVEVGVGREVRLEHHRRLTLELRHPHTPGRLLVLGDVLRHLRRLLRVRERVPALLLRRVRTQQHTVRDVQLDRRRDTRVRLRLLRGVQQTDTRGPHLGGDLRQR